MFHKKKNGKKRLTGVRVVEKRQKVTPSGERRLMRDDLGKCSHCETCDLQGRSKLSGHMDNGSGIHLNLGTRIEQDMLPFHPKLKH